MRPHGILLMMAAAFGAVACFPGAAPPGPQPRMKALEEAVRVRKTDPGRAAELAREAGPGTVLEAYRLRLWLRSLERSEAGSSRWREMLAEPLPRDVRRRALLGLGRSLLREGLQNEAVAVLEKVSAAGDRRADEALLQASDVGIRRRCARRLAVGAPGRLHHADPKLEGAVLLRLTPSERLLRAAAWRRAGAARRAARELGRHRWRGELEAARRVELALDWIAAGRPKRAVRVLPPLRRSGVRALLARARAERRLGWDRFPGRRALRDFRRSLDAARRAVARGEGSLRREALEIVLEMATETGGLDEAWGAWRSLAAAGWQGRRRGWLGRRLGVAMAWHGVWPGRVADLEAELPDHRACLRFWNALGAPGGRRVLREIAATRPGGLYAAWARRELGETAPGRLALAAPGGVGRAPFPVALLLAWGDADGARWQWRVYRKVRGAAPAESLAAAALEAAGPAPGQAIRWLRRTFPRLGSADLEGCAADAVQLYLPLRWVGALRRAAAEAGIDPALLAGVVRQESAFVAHARSGRGAVGLAQMVPATARRHARALGLGARPDLEDPETNLRLAARELAHLLERFGAVEPALAAYNAGEARAARWWARWPGARRFTEEIPVPETYGYVRRVVYLSQAYRAVWGSQLRNTTVRR